MGLGLGLGAALVRRIIDSLVNCLLCITDIQIARKKAIRISKINIEISQQRLFINPY